MFIIITALFPLLRGGKFKMLCVCVLCVRERIGNFKIEPPGLFRGRGDHPKQGMIKVPSCSVVCVVW